MPRCSMIPTLFDEVKTLEMNLLKKYGYLEPCQRLGGQLTYSRHGIRNGSISFSVSTFEEDAGITFDYSYNGTPLRYFLPIVQIPSNLGKGQIWQFICRYTGNNCRKLYLHDGYFKQYKACSDFFYEAQVQSKKYRDLDKIYSKFYNDESLSEIYKPYFKKYYKGKMTKRYRRYLIKHPQTKPPITFENLLMI